MKKNKVDIGIFKDGFTAMAIKSGSEVAGFRGAGGGLVDPSRIAEHYSGIKFKYANIAAYCLRRFGFPVTFWDDDKELCRWVVTTPMPGIYVGITACSVSPFGYVFNEKIEKGMYLEHTATQRKWGQDFKEWAKREKGVILVKQFSWVKTADKKIDREFGKWGENTYKETWEKCKTIEQLAEQIGVSEMDIGKRFFDEKEKEFNELQNEYEKINPFPIDEVGSFDFPYRDMIRVEKILIHIAYYGRKLKLKPISRLFYWLSDKLKKWNEESFYGIPFWHKLPKESLTRKVNEAIYRTLLDLRRPVVVRDWGFNIEGEYPNCHAEYDEEGELIYDYTAPVFEKAGHGVFLETIGSEDWYEVTRMLKERYGNLTRGIKKLKKILNNSPV